MMASALRIVKGAFAVVHGLSQSSPEAELAANELEKRGHRVLGVAIGTEGAMRVAGIVALSDPPRSDFKAHDRSVARPRGPHRHGDGRCGHDGRLRR